MLSHCIHSHAGTNPRSTSVFQVSNITKQPSRIEFKGACFGGVWDGGLGQDKYPGEKKCNKSPIRRTQPNGSNLEGLNILTRPVLLLTLTLTAFSISELSSKSD